jgi:hypothetical protein
LDEGKVKTDLDIRTGERRGVRGVDPLGVGSESRRGEEGIRRVWWLCGSLGRWDGGERMTWVGVEHLEGRKKHLHCAVGERDGYWKEA